MTPLSLADINAVTPYRVVQSTEGDYWFCTDSAINYNISFHEEFEIGGCMAFQFGIFNHEHKHAAFDPKIKETIIAIIIEFFNKNKNILLYTCDSSDRREKARNRLFIRWFKETDVNSKFTICTTETIVEGQGMYVAIIVENDNPRIDAIKEEFEMVSDALMTGQK
ncbi:MAG: hypothetical protein IJM84_02370 [Bacteroidaceae bacterium]|nr:hypothetical protein [Bacteroidaceae bacterium]